MLRASVPLHFCVRWCEYMRAPEVAKWQQRYWIDRDATDGRNGGAQRTVWEILMDMEKSKHRAGEEDSGSGGLGSGPGEGLRARRRPCGLGLGDASQLPMDDLAGASVGILSTRGDCSSKDVWRSRSRPSRLSCQGRSGVACFHELCCRMH